MLLREFLDPSIPFSFYIIESPVDLFLSFPLFAGVVVLFLSFSLVFVDFSIGRGRGGGQGKGGCGFSGFESSLVGDFDGEWWW